MASFPSCPRFRRTSVSPSWLTRTTMPCDSWPRKLPLFDFEAEILARRPNDWDGTLLGKGDVHPTANQGSATPASEPTAENLRSSGYLLRGWLSVKKIGEVKAVVLDGQPLKLARRGQTGQAGPCPAIGRRNAQAAGHARHLLFQRWPRDRRQLGRRARNSRSSRSRK